MDNVTALIKTFLRDDTVFLWIESLRKQFPDMPIIVADDGRPSYVKESFMRGNNIEYYLLPFNRGLPKGRNFLIDKCPTRFCLIGDDDFYYTPCAQLEALLKLMSVADLAGGATIENGQVKHFEGFIHIEDGRMRLEALTTDDMSEIDSVRYK